MTGIYSFKDEKYKKEKFIRVEMGAFIHKLKLIPDPTHTTAGKIPTIPANEVLALLSNLQRMYPRNIKVRRHTEERVVEKLRTDTLGRK